MRVPFVIAVLLALVLGGQATAQTPAPHPAPAAHAAPAKPGAILPGSPLAALTGAATAQSNTDANTPEPFGTSAIGLSVASAIGDEASKTFGHFIAAVQASTRLAPVLNWLKGFSSMPVRRAHLLDVMLALAIAFVPGIAVEAALRFTLSWPRAGLIRRAASRDHTVPEPENGAAGLASAEAGETESRPRRRDTLLAWGRRCLFGLLHFGLSIIPLAGFVITVQSLISSDLLTTRYGHLAVIGTANAYLFCRFALETLRFLFAPGAAGLRVVTMLDSRARWLIHEARLLLATGFAGFVLISVGEVLGLSPDGGKVLGLLTLLTLHIEVAVMVWESRHWVGNWIAGRPDSTSPFAGFRRRLGGIWYIAALFYVLALWIAVAAGVHNALSVLLRIVLVVAVAAALGRLAWMGSSNLLERAFPDAAEVFAQRPAFYRRVRAYNPALRVLVRVVIGILIGLLILQGWGVDAFGWLLTNPFSRSLMGALVSILITIAFALALWEFANHFIHNSIERLASTGRTRQASRLRTLVPMLKASVGVTIFLIAGLFSLTKIGINTAPLLAVSGVLGIAIGFGSQKLVQDVITGLFLLLEDAMQVGDIVNLAGMTGTVERLSIRTIRLRGSDGSINIIPFSSVTAVTNMTRDFGNAQISIEVAYEEDLPRVYAVLDDIARSMREEPRWGAMIRDDLQIFGLDQFGASALVITGQIRTGPGQHWAVRREFYARVKARFEAEHIEMPYTYLPPAPPRVEIESK
jgi:moderate conductance mechanosensitive channel